MTTKEICLMFDKEDGFAEGTHYRLYCINCVVFGVALILLAVVLFLGTL